MTDFLKVATVDADSALPGGALADLRAGELDAVRVDGVFAPELCRRMVEALARNAPGFEETEFPGPFRSFFLGQNLNLNPPDLQDYFRAAARFNAALDRFSITMAAAPFTRVAELISSLDDGRPFLPAPGPEGQTHFATTFRGHHPGGYIPAHFDNEQEFRPSYRHVRSATDGNILSFVVTLAEADAGGMLELYDLLATDCDLCNDDGTRTRPDLTRLRSQVLHVPAGSMILVESGRRLHRVQPVEGAQMRWTMCSFFALSRSGDRNFCWG